MSHISNDQHEAVAAWFLGPKAENFDILRECFEAILATQRETRKCYFPNDQVSITTGMTQSTSFKSSAKRMKQSFQNLLYCLNAYSVPFFSPRYSAHMCMENSVPGILGYLSAMLYNPNNVAFEASPVTTLLEIEVGKQLCKMLGYTTTSVEHPESVGWGHICCDGTVANLESIWAARNLKFYPLSFHKAIAEGAPLGFVAETFKVRTCKGEEKLYKSLDTWELLNLRVDTILEIPHRLYDEYQISPTFLDDVMSKYVIQSVGKETLERQFDITKTPQYFQSRTKHYSWPKGAAIAGIGSDNAVNVEVDFDARLDVKHLERLLMERVENKQAVYAVVAIIGTTEEGAVDPLEEILSLRTKFQEEHGLSFVVHADAAWGGYFASMIRQTLSRTDPNVFVPSVTLCPTTITQLKHLGAVDSITIDPHKAGYIAYPAGALCYRDGRMKNLLTWTAPYLNQGEGESIGIYGVEGSKPGASAAAVWLAHDVIHLNDRGMGALLGEVSFTCRRFASHWSAMSDETTDFIVVPFNPIPAEYEPGSTPAKVENQKKYIRDHILHKENAALVEDQDAMALLKQLGSDLNINAFACNFRIDGKVNRDVDEANYLNRRIFERLSVTTPKESPYSIPFFITSTVFKQSDYGECATQFKKRLGLEGDQDLFVLRNVVMSPFSSSRNFVAELAKIFREVLEEEIQVVRRRDVISPDSHEFVLQGSGPRKYLVYRPMFQKFNSCYQVILSADVKCASLDPNTVYVLKNKTPTTLDDLTCNDFAATITAGSSTIDVQVSNVQVVKQSSLNFNDRGIHPESFMPFYLYGTKDEQHITHLIASDPNIQLCASKVSLGLDKQLSTEDLQKGLIVLANGVHEHSMQPFPPNAKLPTGDKFFFHCGKKLEVSIFNDLSPANTKGTVWLPNVKETQACATGTLTLGNNIFVDNDRINEDPWKFSNTSSGGMSQTTKSEWKDVLLSLVSH